MNQTNNIYFNFYQYTPFRNNNRNLNNHSNDNNGNNNNNNDHDNGFLNNDHHDDNSDNNSDNEYDNMNNNKDDLIKSYYIKKRYKTYCKPNIKVNQIKLINDNDEIINFKLFKEKELEFQSFIEKEVSKKNLNDISNEEDDYLSKEECVEYGENKAKEDLKEAFEFIKKNNINVIHNLNEKLYSKKEFEDLKNKLLDIPKSINFNLKDRYISESEQ